VGSVKTDVKPGHTCDVPAIANGIAYTVTVVDTAQPVPNVYVIDAVPADTPETIPVPEPIAAIAGEPELHTPPPDPLSTVVSLMHT
jgi:hypothetical protein